MAKPIEFITELKGEASRNFVKELENPNSNPNRVTAIKKARNLKIPLF